jgi:two-component system sensor histidine kinase MprB
MSATETAAKPVRHRSIRSQLTVLVTTAVAVAIAVCAVACWFLVRNELYRQAWDSLGQQPPPDKLVRMLQDNCSATPSFTDDRRRFLPMQQLIRADDTRCYQGPDAVKPDPADVEVAKQPGAELRRQGVTEGGDDALVLVRNVGPGTAISVARSLDETERTLRGLALLLMGVAGLGVVGAATAGRLISRTALRPVVHLTSAVEHIAKTEDLHTRIPVEGEDEIARLSASFNAMTAALANSRERQQQLIADAGHELRTPLTSLRTNIDLLIRSESTGRDLAPDARARLLASVKAQMAELSSLVGDLLELSRVSGGEAPVDDLPFHEVVDAAVARARLRAHDTQIEAEVTEWYVHGREGALERAVVNLLDNAVKFSPPGGTITVRLHHGELTVRDQGPGIPEEELPHVFERFWRSTTARSMPGSGLGLAIVAQAVRDAGGEVVLSNAPGGGALARMSLPGKAHAARGTLTPSSS